MPHTENLCPVKLKDLCLEYMSNRGQWWEQDRVTGFNTEKGETFKNEMGISDWVTGDHKILVKSLEPGFLGPSL